VIDLPPRCILLVISAAVAAVTCGSPEPPPVKEPWADIVEIESLVKNSISYDQRLVTVAGWARVEFEGNAIYSTKQDMERGRARTGIWLTLGWPVSADIRKLDGARIIVEGRFNRHNKGHLSSFAGALEEIRRIERRD
jgi:hypothetical protein